MKKPIVALGIVLLSIGAFFLYFGLRAYLYPQVRGHIQGGGAMAAEGGILALVGFILVIWGVVSKKEKE